MAKNTELYYTNEVEVANLTLDNSTTSGLLWTDTDGDGARIYSIAAWTDEASDRLLTVYLAASANEATATLIRRASQKIDAGYGTSTTNPFGKAILTSSENVFAKQDMGGNPYIQVPPGWSVYVGADAVTSGDYIYISAEIEKY